VSGENNSDGKNSLVGEFLLSLAKSPENVQEAVIVQAIKIMMPYYNTLIAPYPMLSHLVEILERQGVLEVPRSKKESA
jgi:hypothetical protein